MAKSSSGEPKSRRAPTRRRTDKTAGNARQAAETPAPAAEPTPEVRGAESPGSLAGEAATSGEMVSERGVVPVAGSAGEPTLAQKVAAAASTGDVWGREGQPDRHAIARRAFELFLQRGGKHGHDLEDWLTAERELRQGAHT
ncbi:MAG TPA: DUF2934 domain-containing protein [Vicinamibacterales bacterium]|nr:DUF2934 domain-containing protein [Vicinamibacterales bacterium]